jgi:hypothetical protein
MCYAAKTAEIFSLPLFPERKSADEACAPSNAARERLSMQTSLISFLIIGKQLSPINLLGTS